jgi:hypothetical protein
MTDLYAPQTDYTPPCTVCGEEITPPKRVQLLRDQERPLLCLFCGEEAARQERAGWTVVQQYGKGPYQLVTPSSANDVLKSTNQKEVRV